MSDPGADLTRIFREESAERLDQMDAALLAVESGAAGAETVDALFRHAHTVKGAAGMLGLDDVRALAHAIENVLAGVREAGTFRPEQAGPLLRGTGALRALAGGDDQPVADVLAELAATTAGPDTQETDTQEPYIPEPDAGGPPPDGPPASPQPDTARSVRVPAGKIDQVVDLVGEVFQYRRRLMHALGTEQPPDVADTLDIGERMLAELKDTAVGLRTLPLTVITGPLPRIVRDLARSAGKTAVLSVSGADTQLDRMILESLADPLTHLLRNAVTHGIESPAGRERAGKPACGHIELRAQPRGSLVEIVIADDGRGVAPEALAEVGGGGTITDVLTRPGYSTAGELTDLAGRGVGLDAVKAYVHSLGGSLDVRSEPGRGMQVVLLLPLALALLEVLVFERGGAAYGVPLAAVQEVVRVTDLLTLERRNALDVRGRSLPVADVAAVLGTPAPPLGDRPPGLVISAGGRRAVITCDALLGDEEVVVKPLGPLLAGVQGYLGAALLGDGRIALLIEPAALTQLQPPGPGRWPAPAAAPGPAASRILVVEDSLTVRELQRSILETAGYQVTTAPDGRAALDALERDPEISLVVTDLEMPELGGLELTRAIRADQARSALPVVIVTSHGSEEDRRTGIAAGADAYMAKRSFDQQSLLVTVERLLGR